MQCACSSRDVDVVAILMFQTLLPGTTLKLALSEAIMFAHWVLVVHLEGTDNVTRAGAHLYIMHIDMLYGI